MIPRKLTPEEIVQTKTAVDAGIHVAVQSHIDDWNKKNLTMLHIGVPDDVLRVSETSPYPTATTSIIVKELILLGISKLVEDLHRVAAQERDFLEKYTNDTQH